LQILAGVFDCRTHDDGTYFYEAFAVAGTRADAGRWRVRRTHKTTGALTWAAGSTDPVHTVTDMPGLFS
jgi:hypothetical protein